MYNKKFSFLKSSNENVEAEKKGDYPIIDPTVIEFLSKEFPHLTENIIDSLMNIQKTLESSIDSIEDKSNEIIKSDRNFSLSGKYRSSAIRLHEISMSIDKYIKWAKEEIKDSNIIKDENSNFKDSLNNISNNEDKLYIHDDFTGKHPKSFELDKFNILVEGWEDLIMNTADILIKNYKHNKDLNTIISEIKTEGKKSIENDFRDTLIEMLTEYKIDPKKYIIKL